jgi:ribosomal protein L37AE/L43A
MDNFTTIDIEDEEYPIAEDEYKPSRCPACDSGFVTETLNSWICADCGATKESPVSRK